MNKRRRPYWSWRMAEFIYPDARLIAGVDEVGRGPLVGAVVT
ncbi:MAG: ribonuclease HII, partial [Mixta calida]|nr:ribonuclease HII [Mixta calida]